MSLITRCPACETLFRVVPDQLRVSEGWVRCGQCHEIFDASLHLQPVPLIEFARPDHGGEPVASSGPSAVEWPTPENSTAAEPVPASEQEMVESAEQAPAIVESTVSPMPALLQALPEDAPQASAEAGVGPHIRLPDPQEDVLASLTPSEEATPFWADPSATLHDMAAGQAELANVSFMRGIGQRSVWHQTWVRVSLALLSLVLVTSLAVQLIRHERDRIAAMEPGLRPWLSVLCEYLACDILPLRQIESMVIESSAFNKLRSDAYRLSFTIRNTAVVALAVPALELTLTDSQDQAMIRHVFLPAELGAPSNLMEPGSEWAGSLAVSVRANGPPDRITGYRVLAFYP